MHNWKGDPTKPMVSICCITYNHEFYIEDALRGFLIQETDFPIEILIHDDASTDKTADIIFEYESKYPNMIKPIYQKENQWSKGKRVLSKNTERASGKYIALCEGDDYWTAPDKLRKQVAFLENNPEYSMCFHNAMVLNHTTSEKHLFANIEEREYSGKEILEKWLIPTASVVYRSELSRRISIVNSYFYGDIFLWLSLAEMGKLYNLNDTMSIYRKHPMGLTSIFSLEKMILLGIQYQSMNAYFNNKFSKIFKKKVSEKYFGAFSIGFKNKEIISLKYLGMSFMNSPKFFFYIILYRLKKYALALLSK